MAKRPGGGMIENTAPTRSQLMPLLSKWGELGTKSQLIPMFVTMITVSLLFIFYNNDEPIIIKILSGKNGNVPDPQFFWYTSNFLVTVAAYLTLVNLYFIYRLAGKKQSWLTMMACTAFTASYIWLMGTQHAFLFIYKFFHIFLAGGEPEGDLPFYTLFYRHFVGTGFFEEFVKALPLLLMVFFASSMSPGLRKHFKLEEPLDGILYGAAAGGGFAFMETIGQYVSGELVQIWETLALNIDKVKHPADIPQLPVDQATDLINRGLNLVGTAPGVQLLIPRSLDQAFGHMAYSGYFGYFIGLSVLRPDKRWRILLIGLASASLPHALWDSIGVFHSDVLKMMVSLLSYGLLAAAILKAREISPNRSLLQRSVVLGDVGQSSQRPPLVETPATPSLRIGTKYFIILPGLQILEHQVPGLQPVTPGGPVAEVTRNPRDPSILGLTNLSQSTWEVIAMNGSRRNIETGQTFKLAAGTRVDFGMVDGEVC